MRHQRDDLPGIDSTGLRTRPYVSSVPRVPVPQGAARTRTRRRRWQRRRPRRRRWSRRAARAVRKHLRVAVGRAVAWRKHPAAETAASSSGLLSHKQAGPQTARCNSQTLAWPPPPPTTTPPTLTPTPPTTTTPTAQSYHHQRYHHQQRSPGVRPSRPEPRRRFP